MENIQRYFFIKTPNESIIHLKNVSVGENVEIRESIDKSEIFVKTTGKLIDKETGKGVKINKIFPPGLTTEVTYLQAYEKLKTWEKEIK